ncbi:MAG: hypothetical protein Q4G14_00050 [Paracoccus sp. (in: a-proteobacteria)]|uniref:MerR family transcriptional regulator n=1 Tax=Paracoccus sp. TaxID=267 RepID=UPI0026DEFC8A|nr:MerR family transcriptional regulator [Paracoccus sp. (in: a-proteobacteria)]MDO5611617.1 hypothetical protein [Paracoccus sp. (in: a-proteobacteria)]
MARIYSESEVIAAVTDLTETRLVAFCRARLVQPVQSDSGARMYREADLARLQLVSDLAETYDLPEDALDMVMSLIDQLNTMRGDMRALMQAVAAEPDEVRTRIHGTLRRLR